MTLPSEPRRSSLARLRTLTGNRDVVPPLPLWLAMPLGLVDFVAVWVAIAGAVSQLDRQNIAGVAIAVAGFTAYFVVMRRIRGRLGNRQARRDLQRGRS